MPCREWGQGGQACSITCSLNCMWGTARPAGLSLTAVPTKVRQPRRPPRVSTPLLDAPTPRHDTHASLDAGAASASPPHPTRIPAQRAPRPAHLVYFQAGLEPRTLHVQHPRRVSQQNADGVFAGHQPPQLCKHLCRGGGGWCVCVCVCVCVCGAGSGWVGRRRGRHSSLVDGRAETVFTRSGQGAGGPHILRPRSASSTATFWVAAVTPKLPPFSPWRHLLDVCPQQHRLRRHKPLDIYVGG